MTLSTALLVDLIILVSCGVVIFVKGGAGHSHPAVIYLMFHLLVVTSRLYAVDEGAPTFLSGLPGYDAVTTQEIYRAALYADLGLVAATIGWMSARKRRRSAATGQEQELITGPREWRTIRPRYVRIVAIAILPLGVLALLRYGFVPGLGSASATDVSLVSLALAWPGLLLIALIYCRGFKLVLFIPLVLYLIIIALQGYSRFRFIVPVVLLVQLYLDRRNRRWPDLRVAGVLFLGLLLFFPLKQIGRSIQASEGIGSIQSASRGSISQALAGESGDQVILDEFALTLSLSDDSGRVFFGRPYLNVLTLPVPRSLWKGKPGLADYLKEISQPSRPLGTLGGVTTLPGDLYLNFRLPGLFLGMFLLARWSARLYEAAYRRAYGSIGHFAFLLLSCNLIQVYRDGLISIPFFLLVQMLPLIAILLLHTVRPATRRARPPTRRAAFSGSEHAASASGNTCRPKEK